MEKFRQVKKTYTIEKKWGETPLESLERLRTEENISKETPMTYAGRLDPAAEGLLIILTGEECKKKEEYTALSKTYEVGIIFGIATDSFDLLGIPTILPVSPVENEDDLHFKIEDFLIGHLEHHPQKYPPYSSKTVDGVQLHTHTKNNTEVELPTHMVALYEYSGFMLEEISREEVVVRATELASIVTGDFRQQEIATAWKNIEQVLPQKIQTTSITLTVSSGFYIRQFVEDLGRALGGGACLYSLIRTGIGNGSGVFP